MSEFNPNLAKATIEQIRLRLEEYAVNDIPEYMVDGMGLPIAATIMDKFWDSADTMFLLDTMKKDEDHVLVPPIMNRVYYQHDTLAVLLVFLKEAFLTEATAKNAATVGSAVAKFHGDLLPLTYVGSDLWRQSMAALSVGPFEFSRFQMERVEALRKFELLITEYIKTVLMLLGRKRLFFFFSDVEKSDVDNINLCIKMMQRCDVTVIVQGEPE